MTIPELERCKLWEQEETHNEIEFYEIELEKERTFKNTP